MEVGLRIGAQSEAAAEVRMSVLTLDDAWSSFACAVDDCSVSAVTGVDAFSTMMAQWYSAFAVQQNDRLCYASELDRVDETMAEVEEEYRGHFVDLTAQTSGDF